MSRSVRCYYTQVDARVLGSEPDLWLPALEPDRRALFLAALERRSDRELEAIAGRVLAWDRSLAAHTAIELLFHVLAGRLLAGDEGWDAEILEGLCAARCARLRYGVMHLGDTIVTASVGGVVLDGAPGATALDHIAAVVAWSLCVAMPASLERVPPEAVGWHADQPTVDLPSVPGPKPKKDGHRDRPEPPPGPAFVRLLAAAPLAMERLGGRLGERPLPEWVLPAALVQRAHRGETLPLGAFRSVLDRRWFAAELTGLAEAEGREVICRVAANLWDAYLTEPAAEGEGMNLGPLVFLEQRTLAGWTIEHLAPDDFDERLTAHQGRLPCVPSSLRPELRNRYAAQAAVHLGGALKAYETWVAPHAVEEDVSGLELLAAAAPDSWQVQRARWKLNGETVYAELRPAILRGLEGMSVVHHLAPRWAVRRLLEEALADAEATPFAIWSWLRNRLPACGAAAPEVWARAQPKPRGT